MLDPVVGNGLGLDLDGAKDIVGQVALQAGGEDTVVVTTDPERASVSLTLDIHTPVTLVEETDGAGVGALAAADVKRDGQGIGQRLLKAAERQLGAVHGTVAA